MNSTPASFKPFQSVLTSSLVRATMYLAGSPLRPRTSLMRPQGERRGSPVAEHDEPRSLNRHPEAQHVTIERQQIAPALAPDRRPPQALDHCHGSFRTRVSMLQATAG